LSHKTVGRLLSLALDVFVRPIIGGERSVLGEKKVAKK